METLLTKEQFDKRIKRILITEEQIKQEIAKVGKLISDPYDIISP